MFYLLQLVIIFSSFSSHHLFSSYHMEISLPDRQKNIDPSFLAAYGIVRGLQDHFRPGKPLSEYAQQAKLLCCNQDIEHFFRNTLSSFSLMYPNISVSIGQEWRCSTQENIFYITVPDNRSFDEQSWGNVLCNMIGIQITHPDNINELSHLLMLKHMHEHKGDMLKKYEREKAHEIPSLEEIDHRLKDYRYCMYKAIIEKLHIKHINTGILDVTAKGVSEYVLSMNACDCLVSSSGVSRSCLVSGVVACLQQGVALFENKTKDEVIHESILASKDQQLMDAHTRYLECELEKTVYLPHKIFYAEVIDKRLDEVCQAEKDLLSK